MGYDGYVSREGFSGDLQGELLKNIPYGKKNAIPMKVLAAKMGVSDRKLRAMIKEARIDRALIALGKGGKGYYRPETKEELEEFLAFMDKSARTHYICTNGARAALQNIEEGRTEWKAEYRQTDLWEQGD
ncbi:MAG: hypothetical protein IJT43_11825 [Stomatobaculum sp.]|nr:hypothetical protein [Stomatobaculum sp.]